jgi:hypothetical protein
LFDMYQSNTFLHFATRMEYWRLCLSFFPLSDNLNNRLLVFRSICRQMACLC